MTTHPTRPHLVGCLLLACAMFAAGCSGDDGAADASAGDSDAADDPSAAPGEDDTTSADDGATSAEGPADDEAPDAEAVRGGEVVVAFPNEPATLDPAFSTAISSDRNILNLFYDPLLRMDMDGELQPALATEWAVSEDDLQVTLTLRDGVTFHDGTPLDADAVAANLNRIRDEAVASPKAPTLASVDEVVVEDDVTVVLELSRPDPVLLTHLAHESGMIASPSALDAGGEDYGREPVGTGPFTFEEWRTGVELTAQASGDYWATGPDGEQLPRLDSVRYRFITDEQVSLAELRTGGVDLVFNLPPSSFAQAESDPAIAVDEVGRRRSYYVTLNVTRPPFDDARVREAFSLAIDRGQVGDVTAAGEYDLAPSFATTSDFFYTDAVPVPERDPDAARALLAEAGVEDNVEMTILVRRRQPDPQIAELLQAQLAEAGITATVEVAEFQSVLERLQSQDFDAGVLVIDVPRVDPSLTFDPYFVSGAGSNWSGLSDPVLDEALAEAVTVPDPEERAALYEQVQQRIHDESYWAFLHQPRSPIFRSAQLQGLVYDVDRQWRLDQAFISPS